MILTVTRPATRFAMSSSDCLRDKVRRAAGLRELKEVEAVLRASVSSLMRGVTVSSVAFPLVPRAAVK